MARRIPQDRTLLMIGTRKGLWIGRSDDARMEWEFTGPHFDMEEVYSCLIDVRSEPPRLLAGASSSWLGPQVWRSDDLGASWQETPNGAVRFPADTDATVERVWQLVAGSEPGVVYAGSEPAAVWRSTDQGETFTLERRLWDHPHRPDWAAGFGVRPSTPCCRTPRTRRASPPRCRPAASTRPTTAVGPGSRATTDPRRVPARGPAVPRVRPVRPQGHPPPEQAGTALPPEPRRGLPLRRRGPDLEVDRRRTACRLRVPDRGPPP